MAQRTLYYLFFVFYIMEFFAFFWPIFVDVFVIYLLFFIYIAVLIFSSYFIALVSGHLLSPQFQSIHQSKH